MSRQRAWLHQRAAFWFSEHRLKRLLSFGLIMLGLRNAVTALAAVPFTLAFLDPDSARQLMAASWPDGNPSDMTRFYLLVLGLILEGVIGVLLLLAAWLVRVDDGERGMRLGYWVLLFNLTAVHPLVFYYNQFDVISTTIVQFTLFVGVLYYRSHYLRSGQDLASRCPGPNGEATALPPD